MSCQFIGCSKKFWIQNSHVIPEDGVASVNRSSKYHPECYGEEGDCSDTSTAMLNDPSCFAIYNLNDWLAYTSNTSRHRRNKTKKMHKAMYKIPDELWRDDPQMTASKNWENDIDKTNIDDILLAVDKNSMDEPEMEENRTSVKKSKVINEAGKGNNNNVKGVNMSTSVDGHSNSVSNAVLKESVDDTILEKPNESSSNTSAEAFFEAIPAEDAFNSLYSELVVARTQVEAMAEELRFSMATNEVLKKELKRYRTTSAACTDERENFSQQINSQAEMLKGYSEKSMEQSNELKNLSEKNQRLLVELKSEKDQSEMVSLEFKELKNKFKMQNDELEKQKTELSDAKRLESIRLLEINSLKEKLEIQLKQGKVLKDLKSWESGELKRMKMEAISKTAKLKLIEEQDRMKAKDLERLNNDLQLRGKEVHSIKTIICCQSRALFRLRCLAQSTDANGPCCSEATAGAERERICKEICETKSEIGCGTIDSLQDDLSKISEVLCTNETNAEQLKSEIAALLTQQHQLQGDCATASAKVLQLREANDSKSQELTLMKRQMSTNFQKFHTNQEFLSSKLLRSKVNEQLLTKALEKLRQRDESLTELLKASDETMQSHLSHQNVLSQEVLQLRTKSDELASELQKSRSSEEDARKELQVEKTLTGNLSTKLQHFEGKLDLSSDELRKFETRADSFLTEVQLSREHESQLCEEVHQVRLQLQTSETQLRKSEESIGLLSKETGVLKVRIDLLTAELEKSKTNEQSLLSKLQSKSDGMSSSFHQKVVSSGKPSDVSLQGNSSSSSSSSSSRHACSTDCKANAELNLKEENHLSEKENVVKTGRHDNGNIERQPKQDRDCPVPVTPQPCRPMERVKSSADFRHSENAKVIKIHPRDKVNETLSTEVKDLTMEDKAGDVGAEKNGTSTDQTKIKDACKQKKVSVSEKKSSDVGDDDDSTTIDRRHGASSQLNVIRELEHKVALQSAEIKQYEEKLRSLLYEILLQNQQNCCRNEAISSSQGDPLSTAKPDIEMIYEQLGKEKKFREDLLAWNELNTQELMNHVSTIQCLISSSQVQIEKLFNSFNKHQLRSDSEPRARDKSGTGSLLTQDKLTCGISENTLATEYSSEGSDSTAKSQDDTRFRGSLKHRKPQSTAFQKFSKQSRNEDQASATHRPLNEKEKTTRRSKYRQEYNDRGQRDTKSCNFDSFGCPALATSSSRDTADIAVFDRCELDEVGSQTRSLTGLTRKQPTSPSAKRKLKEFEQLQARCENLLTSAACPTTGDTVQDTGEKSDARYCVSTPKTPGTVVTSDSNTPVDLRRTEQEAEWFHKDREEQDTAYEALKHIKLNLNYFLESLTEVQPDNISLDVVQYPTAKDASHVYEADGFVKDFHIPNHRVISSSAFPEKVSTGTKYNLQIPVSRLRDLIFPRCVETSGRNLFTHRTDAVLNSVAPGDQCSSSLSLNVASSVPRKDVVVVKTHLPKYMRIDDKQSAGNLVPNRPKIEFIDDRRRSDGLSVFICPPSVVEAKGDSSSAVCPSAADRDQTFVCQNKCASVVHHGERLPMYVADGISNDRARINRCPPPVVKGGGGGGGRKSSGYADIVNKRVTLIADRKRNNQIVTRRILPAKQQGHL